MKSNHRGSVSFIQACFIFLFTVSGFALWPLSSYSQHKLWEDSFNGGVTSGGYSPDAESGGKGTFELNIEKGSTIRKAYLLAGRFGDAKPLTITLNGKDYLFDHNNIATPEYNSRVYGGLSCVHVLDITNDIDPKVSSYTINVPLQVGPMNRYNDFYLFVAYNNASLKKVNAAIFLRTTDISAHDKFKINLNIPTRKAADVAVSLYCGYICHMRGDGEFVFLNGDKLGQLGGHDSNSGYCGGPIGSFYYKDNKLYALGDDKVDKNVNGSDALINAKSLLKDKTKGFDMDFEEDKSVYSPHETNSIWGVIIAYGTGECTLQNTTLTDDQGLCKGSSLTLKAGGGTKYIWSTGVKSDSIIVNPLVTTKYYVTISNGTCTAMDSVAINVFDPQQVDAGRDTTICQGQPVMLTARGGGRYLWSDGEKTQSIAVWPQHTTTYLLTVSEGNCSATDKVTVTVNYIPTIDAGNDITVLSDSSATINLRGPEGNYKWRPENGLSCINCKSPTASPDSTTTYIVTYTATNGCAISDTITVHSKVHQAYYITNPFTPNGDGNNDIFMVSLRRGKLLNYTIFDKKERLVFRSTNDIYAWDGKFHNEDMPTGVYIYHLNYTDEQGRSIQKTGTFNLIR